MKKNKPFIVIGSGGHAAVIIDLLESHNFLIAGVLVKEYTENNFLNYPVIGDDSVLNKKNAKKYSYAIGVGQSNGSLEARNLIYKKLSKLQLSMPPLVHKDAIISPHAILDEGCQILMGAKIGVNTQIGLNTIINTNVSIDHDSVVGKNCHIAPGTTICGKVCIGENSFIGAGTTIIDNIKISKNCLIGAGSLVLKNILISGKYFGHPVRRVK